MNLEKFDEGGDQSNVADGETLSSSELELLKVQIMAFKLLNANIPLPEEIQSKLITNEMRSDMDKKHQNPDKDVQDSQPVEVKNVSNQSTMSENEMIDLPSGSSITMKILYLLLHNNNTAKSRFLSTYKGLFPCIIPEPINLIGFLYDKEKLTRLQIDNRIKYLENMQANISPSKKLKVLIEYKSLRLYDYQRKFRQELIESVQKVSTHITGSNIIQYTKGRRTKGQRFIERKDTSFTKARFDRNKREKLHHLQFINNVIERSKEFYMFHKNQYIQKTFKLLKNIIHIHNQYEKEETKRLDKLARERLTALKADDEEAYLKLIDQQKDKRLTHLIEQTDLFLSNLADSVLLQKSDTIHRQDDTLDSNEEVVLTNEKVDYYTTAHKITEDIKKQPEMLVGGTLKDYQIKGLQWMISLYNNKLNGILADEMGLGKTIQTIALIAYLLETKKKSGPYLIVVPLSTITNWSLEFDRWCPSIIKVEYKGSPHTRKFVQNDLKHGKFNVVLTTYEYVIKDKNFLSKIRWLYMIIDEGHRMKNAQSKLTNILSNYYVAKYRLILTGTPLQNNLPELWSLLNFILPKIFNSSKGFDEWFNAPFENMGERLELNEEEMLLIIRRLHKMLRPFLLRRLKKDVECELPDKIETIVKCPMSILQRKLYSIIKEKTLVSSDKSEGKGFWIRRFNNTIMQLRKICNHPFVFEEVERQINVNKGNNELLYRVSGKFEFLQRVLPKFKASGHRVLIFFQMTTVMTIMEDFLTMENHCYMRLDGSTKAEDRSEMLKKFNDLKSPYFIFLLSTRAGGLGLNLQSADTVIIFDSDWNPHQDLQAQDRAHRIGQTKEVRILRLMTVNSIEEMILARAQYKLNLDGKIIQAGKFDNKSTNEEREAMLRSLMETEQNSQKQEKQHVNDEDIYNNDDLNKMLARSPEELVLFKKMDIEYNEDIKKKYGSEYTRLISEKELPDIYLDSVCSNEKEKVEPNEYGRGQRRRNKISCDNGLSDEVYSEYDEDTYSDDEESDVETKKRKKQKVSSQNKSNNIKIRLVSKSES